MSLPLDPNQARLTSYLDDELDVRERAEFEAALATDAGLAAELERTRALRALLEREAVAATAPDPGAAAFDALWLQLDAELGPAQASASPDSTQTAPTRAVVIPLDRARAKRRAVIGSVVAFAAAAAVAVVTLVPGRPTTHSEGGRVAGTTGASPTRMNGTEIIRVEFGKSSGTFWEQAEGGDRVAIVWIDDTMLGEVARP